MESARTAADRSCCFRAKRNARIRMNKSDSASSPRSRPDRSGLVCLPRDAASFGPALARRSARSRARNHIHARPATCARNADAPEMRACGDRAMVIVPSPSESAPRSVSNCSARSKCFRIGRFEPAKRCDVFDAARFQASARLPRDRAASLRAVPAPARSRCSRSVQSRKQRPGAVRPARPAR